MPGHEHTRPRRPAMLTAATADAIIGDEDPATTSALAHSSAWALMGVGDEDFTADALTRLRTLVHTCGSDAIAYLWARSPAFTLPGALWRLHLLVEWCERDLAHARSLYDAGACAQHSHSRECATDTPNFDAPGLDATLDMAHALLRGDLSEDELDQVLTCAAHVLRLFAAGDTSAGTWISDPKDPLAYTVTTRAKAFLATAEELEEAARAARVGALD